MSKKIALCAAALLALTLTLNANAAPKITSKVVLSPIQALTPTEAESLSLAAGKLLNHTDKARLELKAHEIEKAKQDVEKALTLANIVKEGVPGFNVKTEIAAGDRKYVDETEVKAWLVPLHEELNAVKVLEPIRAAKKDANAARNRAATDAGKPQPEQIVQT